MLILKILDSHPDGQALTSEIAREVALLDAAAQEIFLPSRSIEGGIFGAGFVTILRKGVWRISNNGRQTSGLPIREVIPQPKETRRTRLGARRHGREA